MSAETLKALEAAIQEHTKDEGNGDLTAAWVLVTGSMSLSDGEGDELWYESPPTQPKYVTIGLLEGAQIMIRSEVYSAVIG